MNLKLVAYTLLAIAGPLLVQTRAHEGKVGSVTLALTATTEVGAFKGDDYKLITSTPTLLKDVVQTIAVKRKYSTKEFIQDLIIRYDLQGPSSNWSLQYVESAEEDFSGYFLVSKAGRIQCIGTNSPYEEDAAIAWTTYEEGFFTVNVHTETSTIAFVNGREVSGTTTDKFSRTSFANFQLDPTGNDYLSLAGISSESGSSRFSYTINPETSDQTDTEDTYTVGARSVSNIQGFAFSETPTLLTGSISISALKKVSDISAYVDAWLEF